MSPHRGLSPSMVAVRFAPAVGFVAIGIADTRCPAAMREKNIHLVILISVVIDVATVDVAVVYVVSMIRETTDKPDGTYRLHSSQALRSLKVTLVSSHQV